MKIHMPIILLSGFLAAGAALAAEPVGDAQAQADALLQPATNAPLRTRHLDAETSAHAERVGAQTQAGNLLKGQADASATRPPLAAALRTRRIGMGDAHAQAQQLLRGESL